MEEDVANIGAFKRSPNPVDKHVGSHLADAGAVAAMVLWLR
jgi:hypothetical protein